MAEWKNPKLTVDALVPWADGVLLVRRAREPFADTWALPGGFVEYGEAPEAAVVRELKEETGLEGRVRSLLGVYGDPSRDPRGHTVSIVYVVDAHGAPRAGDDAAEARSWPWDSLPRLAFDHARILADGRAALRP
ncbi:MAG TPA: NUDIX hydrolase [Candidatus Thermoplasmatota archaeon]|jgi:8-oxo-dGTP diphosphatase|nr:NUDIX hydrolase [Candidatus Thermoplasmatota archaeon]